MLAHVVRHCHPLGTVRGPVSFATRRSTALAEHAGAEAGTTPWRASGVAHGTRVTSGTRVRP